MYNTLSNAIKTANQKSFLNKTALLTSSAAIVLMGMTTPVYAQESAAETEEVVVTGIRGALKNAVDIKRNAASGVDAVSAEDVGKFPDKNVAESLGRIPGVSVSGQFGEGDAVSIRGASNQFTLTQLNGQNVASSGWYSEQPDDRSFNYSMLPSELIAGMEVHKSSQADLTEGGVGGTVNVKTRKPLDMDANSGVVSVKAAQASTADTTDPEFSGMYSFKNDSENFGVLVAATSSEYNMVRRGFETTPTWNNYTAATNFNTNKERQAVNATLQFKPNDSMEFGVSYLDMSLQLNNVNAAVWLNGTPGPTDKPCQTNFQGVNNYCEHLKGADGPSYYDVRSRQAEMTSETLDAWFNIALDDSTLAFRLGNTEATGGTSFENHIWTEIAAPTAGITDSRGEKVKLTGNYDSSVKNLNPALSMLDMGAVIKAPGFDEELYAQVDFTKNVDIGAFKSIKAGLRFTDHSAGSTAMRYNGAYAFDVTKGNEAPSKLTDGTLLAGRDGGVYIPKPNVAYLDAETKKIAGNSFALDRSSLRDLTEENTALYVMGNFEVQGVRGNVGLRYIQTDAASEYYLPGANPTDATNVPANKGFTTKKVSDDASYNDVLPSFNIAFDLTDDLLLRASAAKVITRANYTDMYATSSVSGLNNQNNTDGSVTKGNVGLLPYAANQADIGLEWYFAPGSLVSAAVFTKSVSNFTTGTTLQHQALGIPDPDKGGRDDWELVSKVNGSSGDIRGLEFQVQHTLESGFGGLFTYTYAEAYAPKSNFVDGNPQLTESSHNTFNVVGFYENDAFSARLAYNWRSEYILREEPGFYKNRFVMPSGSLDFSASYHVIDNLTITLDATNLLKEDVVQVGRNQGPTSSSGQAAWGNPVASYEGISRISLGASYKF